MVYPVSHYFTPDKWPFFGIAIILSAVSSMVSYAIVAAGIKIRVQRFMSYIMGGMMMKLFVGIASITVVAWKYKENASIYVLTYFVSYIIFTAFEVYTLMRNLRPQNQKGSSISHEDSGHK
jgi:hypothetical protein